MKSHLLILILALSLSACNSQNHMVDKTVVPQLDLEKYLGAWYELARYDHSFEKGLVGVTATYSMREDGKIKVVNTGYKNTLDGPKSEAIGKAKIPNSNESAKLKVSFFWIFYADYFILELDEDYQWAIIGSKSDKYLWILSRTPQVSDSLYKDLLSKIEKRGYDTNLLIEVEQKKEHK